MKNINYITLNCFQSDSTVYVVYICIMYTYTRILPVNNTVTYLFGGAHSKTPSIKLLKKIIELPIILNDHILCALLIGLT